MTFVQRTPCLCGSRVEALLQPQGCSDDDPVGFGQCNCAESELSPAEVDKDVDITESSAAEVGVVKFLARIVDRPGHTERLEMFQLLSRCVTDDSRAQLLRHLHDLVTDGAATAEDEHALPAAHISGFVHDLVSRRGRQRDRRSSREIQRIGNAHKVARR